MRPPLPTPSVEGSQRLHAVSADSHALIRISALPYVHERPRRLLAAISAAEAEGAPAPSPRRCAGARTGLAEHATARHLKPVVTAVEMVFGSAAALSAAFGLRARPRGPQTGALVGCRGRPGSHLAPGGAAAISAAVGQCVPRVLRDRGLRPLDRTLLPAGAWRALAGRRSSGTERSMAFCV